MNHNLDLHYLNSHSLIGNLWYSTYLLGITDIKYTQDELDFYNELTKKSIEELIQQYNITRGEAALEEKEERRLIKLIKSFMEDEE